MKKILVTGASGYVGSHTVKYFAKTGLEVVGMDQEPPSDVLRNYLEDFLTCDISDENEILPFLEKNDVVGVVHCAAKCLVGESVQKPELYEDYNVKRSSAFLDILEKAGVSRLVFSSTAAVYGEPESTPIIETHTKKPINPYGQTKLKFENKLLERQELGKIQVGIFRYFNAAGADPEAEIGEVHDPETHLIPNALRAALGLGPNLQIFGTDYPTRDGTCERDYVHVWDLAQAHFLALKKLESARFPLIYNLGSRIGYTVGEVVGEIDIQFGKPIPRENRPRRLGDPAVLVADPTKAKQELRWNPQFSELRTIVSTALAWHKHN